MALQQINWSQIDTPNVPSGYTVNIGQFGTGTSVNSVHTNQLSIIGVDFFDYLEAVGYTGATPNTVYAEDNAGILVTHQPSGTTLATIYNTTLDSSLATPSDVGGIPAGTTVAQLTGKTFVEFVDDLLFPVVLPTYTIPTISISGSPSGTHEIGETLIPNINVYGIKNDAGAFTQIRILRSGSAVQTNTSFTISGESDIASQFGFIDPNNPNYRYTIPTPYTTPYIIPYSSYPVTITYSADSNYGAGLPKKDNKGDFDTRTPAVRSTSAPQAAGTNFAASTSTVTAIFPYFWGTSVTLPTNVSIATQISSGGANKVLSSASSTLTIPYNMGAGTYLYIWVAYFENYTTKTKWYVTPLDAGDIDNSFITTAVTSPVNSPNGYWTALNFKMHWSVYPTEQNGNFEFRNS